MSDVGERAQELLQGIRETAQTLRDEHFPYESGLRIYETLHRVLSLLDDEAGAFVKWAEFFPDRNQADLGLDSLERLHMVGHIHHTIKEALG